MDHRDAGIQRVQRRADHQRLAGKADLAAVGRVDAGDDLHQRGLARAVLAHQRMDRPRPDPQLHIVQRDNAGEFLADVVHFQDVFTRVCAARRGARCV